MGTIETRFMGISLLCVPLSLLSGVLFALTNRPIFGIGLFVFMGISYLIVFARLGMYAINLILGKDA